jgi:glucan 1,3-beta-glucosidase
MQPWITPSLFDNTNNTNIVDEWTFGQFQSYDVAYKTLVNHWNTWITEDDFKAIAEAGCAVGLLIQYALLNAEARFVRLNHVRIPIGYWAFQVGLGEPYVQGQLPYLRSAINWATKYKLNVIIDLHGAPGSQNGYASPRLP